METKVALLGIIVENQEAIAGMNELLHQYGSYICGRMGVPHVEKRMNIISVVLDAPEEAINALAGRLEILDGITSRVIY